MLHLQTPTTPQSYGNQYKPQHEQHKQHKQHVAFTTPTKTFRYPNTPTSTVATARTAYSIEDRLDDRMNANIYNSAPIAMNSRDDVNVNDIDYTIKPTASSNSSLEEASVASSSSTAQNFNVENGVAFAKSQAALNKDYKNRRMAIKKLPLSARATTGINLKNLHPLAVRNGELC
eukprot:CAMPEP_0168197128 /NCGR_PEP_ID=MMETSP0139_2-20121125/20957_1 /TAXON_ID=44445 /ORGANISM="Pseudo-nitzschia australis, Strain 10249 10 AB" /LENGTH=174 /DNA_ID=CAMNT_0008121495 /DNA_START=188 /DNA_END=712 /DNA_ORIENTATION=+